MYEACPSKETLSLLPYTTCIAVSLVVRSPAQAAVENIILLYPLLS